jgi:hypothetical protein
MAQRKATRQSDLQPVYDLIDALQPAHIKAAYKRLNRRTRAILLISVATVVLLWALFSILGFAMNYVKNTTGPFLTEALKTSYNLEARVMPLPPVDQTSLLPNAVANYTLVGSPYQATPVPAKTGKNNKADAQPTVVPPAPVINSPLGTCLTTAIIGADPANCTGLPAVYTAMGDYQNAAGTTVNVSMALFTSHTEAGDVMRKLQQQAAVGGSLGNYAIGVTQVDYFYSSQPQVYMFSWANGSWVYTAVSSSSEDLDQFVKNFPY